MSLNIHLAKLGLVPPVSVYSLGRACSVTALPPPAASTFSFRHLDGPQNLLPEVEVLYSILWPQIRHSVLSGSESVSHASVEVLMFEWGLFMVLARSPYPWPRLALGS